MARIACTSLELSYANLIISNIYGKGESSPRLLNTLIRKMMRGEPADLTEGRQLYDFIYIDDAVRAIAQGIMDDEEGASYYIGNEQQRPLREWIEEMKDALSSTSVLNFGVIPFDGAMLTYREFDHTRLHRKGFVPQVSFSEGVQRTRDWLLEVEG